MSRSRPERRGRPAEEAEQGALQPKYRRAFGCVTWVNMAVLTFLLVTFLLVLPFRYIGGGEVYSATLLGVAFVGIILIVPGMALGAVLGARTYRVERRVGTRAGAGIGATAGLTSYLFFFLVGIVLVYGSVPVLLVPLAASFGLLLYALFATGQSLRRRRQAVLFAATLCALSGAGYFFFNFDSLALLGALVSTVAAAVGGYVGGIGYARAGGDAMMPPGAVRRNGGRPKTDS